MSNWISIEDRLPSEDIIVMASDGRIVSEMYFGNGNFKIPLSCVIPDNEDILFIKSITHWMPLPEPPKQKQTQPANTINLNGVYVNKLEN